jgi:hypothetical protein
MIESLICEVICILVNNDKIGIHFVPIAREKTWENKGTKQNSSVRTLGWRIRNK